MNLRKLIASAAILMSLILVHANAAFSDQDKIEHIEAVEMNVILNIIQGREDGSFDPQGQITRAEMAKMIYMILNGGSDPALDTKSDSGFQDIKGHWAETYIEFCISMGSVSGLGDGNFNPDGSVTSTQAAKMLLVLLGYDAEREQFSGPNWFLKINAAANQKELYQEITVDPNAPLTREKAAQMIWNALRASEIEYKSSTGVKTNTVPAHEDKKSTLLESKFHTDGDCQGKMTGYRWNEANRRFDYEIEGQGTYFSSTDYTNLFGLVVNVVHQEDKSRNIYGMYVSKSRVLAAGVAGDLEKSNTKNQIQFKKLSYTIDYAVPGESASPEDVLHALPVYAENDGQNQETYLSAALSSHQAYEVRLLDRDGNGKVDYVVYRPFSVGQISEANANTVTVKNLQDFDLSKGEESLVLDRSGNRMEKGIAVGDYVKIIPQESTPYGGHKVTLLPSFEGTVSDIREEKILVNDTWYENHKALPIEKDRRYKFYTEGSYLYEMEDMEQAKEQAKEQS